MAGLNDIVCAPDDRLQAECESIEKVDSKVKALARRMLKDMYAAEGCGLAAPQVGELVQLIVIDVDYAEGTKNPYVLINPRIVTADGPERETSEGCLSFPGISVSVKRPSHVIVEARDLKGELMRYEAQDNLLAVCLQHEIDHIHGITMIDHLSPAKRVAAMREYQEALAAGARPGDTKIVRKG